MPIELPPGTAAYSEDNSPPQNRQLLVLFGFFVAVGVVLFWALGWLINSVVWYIPPRVEQQLGALIVPSYEKQAEASTVQTTLNQLLDRLETQLPPEQRQGRDYQVLYIPGKTVNALAIPGDRVILYSGLLKDMASENELMMVMGHELGHFAHRDHLRGLGRSLVLRLAIAALLGDPGSLQTIAASGLVSLGEAQFSQNQEREADQFGLALLSRTYGHVAGATDFFERMSRKDTPNLAFLATHPTSQDRVSRIQQQIQAQGYAVKMRSPLPETLKNLE